MSSNTNLYGIGSSGTSLVAAGVIPVVRDYDPTPNDITGPAGTFLVGQMWINTVTESCFQVTSLSSVNGSVSATWTLLNGGSSSLVTLSGDSGTATPTLGNIEIAGGTNIVTSASGSTVTISATSLSAGIDTIGTQTGTNPITPSAGLVNISGAVVAAGTNPVRSDGTSANTLTLEVQTSQALASADATKIGLCNFNSSDFTVTPSGFVSSIGGGFSRFVGIDTSTPPGTNPVAPDSGGVITVTGGQVASGTTANVIQTDSVAANNYAIQIQRSTVAASSNAAVNGVSHFNSADFTIDSNGFVSSMGGGFSRQVGVNAFTFPGTNPVIPSAAGLITVNGGQVAAGTISSAIQTNSLAANTYTVQVQRSSISGASNMNLNGVCHFNSADFTVDVNGFVSSTGGVGGLSSINVQVFTASGTYTPTPGMLFAWVQIVGGGGGGGGGSIDGGDTAPAGSGGGGGLYASKVFTTATIGASQAVTIGSGGAGGIGQADGISGSASSLGSLLVVAGGVNGEYMRGTGPIQEGGDGGQALTGTADYSSFGGGGGYAINVGGAIVSGAGGSSLLSPGGKPRGIPADGVSGGGYGGGGSGGVASTGVPATGGNGDNGVVIITEYI